MLDKWGWMQVLNLWVLSHSPRKLCPLQGGLTQLPKKTQFVFVLCSSQHSNEAPCFSPSQYPLFSAHPTPSLSNLSSSRNCSFTPLSWFVIQICLSISSPSICHEVMGPDAMTLVFWMLSFKPVVSLFSFTFIKRLFYLRLCMMVPHQNSGDRKSVV